MRPDNLMSGHTGSCGCMKGARITKRKTRHGMAGTPTYISWLSMHERCTNPKFKQFHDYGGRGIRICERWELFESFLADMGERPPGRTLDRWPDNDGNYEPGNCRWATPKEQARNSRSPKFVQFRGNLLTYKEAAKEAGIGYSTLRKRIRRGATPEQALVMKFRKRVYVEAVCESA